MMSSNYQIIITLNLSFSIISKPFNWFFLNEDSNGGAIIDYGGYLSIIKDFNLDFNHTFLNFDNYGKDILSINYIVIISLQIKYR